MIIDLKNIYGYCKNRKFDLTETLNVIYQIIKILKEISYSFKNKKLYNQIK